MGLVDPLEIAPFMCDFTHDQVSVHVCCAFLFVVQIFLVKQPIKLSIRQRKFEQSIDALRMFIKLCKKLALREVVTIVVSCRSTSSVKSYS